MEVIEMLSPLGSEPMRLIGEWHLSQSEYLPPQEFVRPIPLEDKTEIARYLAHGEVFMTFRGYWHCLMCDCPLGFRQLADGYWVWPEGLVHYVSDHSVGLPDEFIEHVRSGVPRLPKEKWALAKPVDSNYWIDWCRRNSRGLFTERILEARNEADTQYERWLEAEAEKRKLSEGLSNVTCQFMGGERMALKNRWVCARCALANPELRRARGLDWRQVFK